MLITPESTPTVGGLPRQEPTHLSPKMWTNSCGTIKIFLILFSAGNDGVDEDGDGVIDFDIHGKPGHGQKLHHRRRLGKITDPNGSTPTPGLMDNTWGWGWPSDYPANPINSDHVSDDATGMAAFSSRGPCLDGRIKA